tara:strand:- start:69 stop:335 length:267 start_codon:yes stop_codon:yes gene_type:complete
MDRGGKMKINLNEKELAMLVHLIWKAEGEGEFVPYYPNNPGEHIPVFVGNPDGSDDYWLPTTEKEFYALLNKITNSLSKEFKKNKGAK